MLRNLRYFFQQSWLVIVSSFFFGLVLAVTNAALSPKIEQNKIEKVNRLMSGLLPEAEKFLSKAELEITSAKGKKLKTNIYEAISGANKPIGWAFKAQGAGFQDKIELVLAVDADFRKLAGFAVLSSNETPGFGNHIKDSYYRNQFRGAPAEHLELVKQGNAGAIDSEIVAISGATVSSEAVVKIVNNYITQVKEQLQEKGLIGNGK